MTRPNAYLSVRIEARRKKTPKEPDVLAFDPRVLSVRACYSHARRHLFAKSWGNDGGSGWLQMPRRASDGA